MIEEQTLEHGQRVGELRWCGVCHEYHYRNYVCDYYYKTIRDEIQADIQSYLEQLRDTGIRGSMDGRALRMALYY